MIGKALSHYRLLEQIGAGGMGVVYRAHDEHLDRDVAVKVLPTGVLADDDARQRFRREAHALSRLNHPHIATVHDFDTQDGVDFLVMELVTGTPLDERLKGGALPEAEVCALGAQIAEALEAAHEQGIVHRDLKPGNVMLTAKGQVKVLDFGLARLLRPAEGTDLTRSLTEADVTVGTIPYMAPEQLLERKVDARADLYSLGVVLYELATGRSPYREKIPTALVYEIVHQAVTPLRETMPQISPRLEAIILNCLEKDPATRYASARVLADDLRSGAPVARRRRPVPRAVVLPAMALAAALIVVVAFDLGGLRSSFTGTGRIESIAVMPLDNPSGDPEQAFFADGISEELSTHLAGIAALRVIAHSSVREYGKKHGSLADAARVLKVASILRGSVRRDANRVRISVQLWAESYERDLRDVFALQSEVAQAIADQIRVAVTPQERARLAASRKVDPAAHEEYLKGRFHWNRFQEEGFRRALDHFKRAIEIDPGFALAYVGLADAYSGLATIYMPTDEAMPRIAAAAAKALELDPELPEAYAARGYPKAFYQWQWRDAESDFKRAIALNPGNSVAHTEYGYMLVCLGRFDEAIARLARAHEIDPLSTLIASVQLWPLFEGRRYDEAIAAAQRLIREDSLAWNAHQVLAQAQAMKGQFDQAIATIQRAGMSLPQASFGGLAHIYALQGRRDDALREIDPVVRAGSYPYSIAMVYGALGMNDEAFAWLEKDMKARTETVVWLKVDPQMDPLRSDPRYDALLRRLGFAS